jgi:hypothetical protein
LAPRDVLRDLPVATDREDISRVVAENDELRARINAAIGDIWRRKSTKDKHKLRASVLANREAFEALLAIAKALPKTAYDLDSDPSGMVKWLDLGQKIAHDFPLPLSLATHDESGLKTVVERIIENYKYVIENQGVWTLLYDNVDKPLHERVSQKVFFVAADAYCRANNVDITPEANSGSGPVDFKLSKGYHSRAVVELKLSTNNKLLHGYTEQLEAYKRGERTDAGYFVILDVGGSSKQVDRVLKLESTARGAKAPHSPVTVIDASRRRSASKI